MLFLGGLTEAEGSFTRGLSFAHSSLIVRSSFAEGSNRKFFCWGMLDFRSFFVTYSAAPARCDILGCASSPTMLKV